MTTHPSRLHRQIPAQASRSLRRLVNAISAFLLVFSVADPSFAQTGEDQIFTEVFDVTVASVEVYVTDKKERPVSGLTADDFELFVDGESVDIINFYAESSTAERSRTSSSPVPSETGSGAAGATTQVPVYMAVFFDDVNTRPGGRNRLLEDLEAFLNERVGEATHILLARYNGSLEIVRPFFDDKTSLNEGLAQISASPAMGNHWSRERRSAYQAVQQTYVTYQEAGFDPCVEAIPDMVNIARGFGGALENSTAHALSNLANMTSALAGLDGRKTVLYVGDGLPLRAGIDVFHFITEICPVAERDVQPSFFEFDASRRFRELTTHANANGVTYFTLQASGLDPGSGGGIDTTDRKFSPSPTNDSVRTANDQQGLFTLADETGGRAIFNTNRFATELDAIEAEVRTLYSLGFEPPRGRRDGRDMWIKVKMKDRGLRVRHRHTYRIKPDEERIGERALGTLFFGQEQNPLQASVEVGEIVRKDAELSQVVLRISVPTDRLMAQPRVATGSGFQSGSEAGAESGSESGRVRLLVTGRDATGRIFGVRQKMIPVAMATGDDPSADGTTGSGTGGQSIFDIGIDLADGDYEVAVAVRDEVAVTTSFLRYSFSVSGESSEPANSSETVE